MTIKERNAYIAGIVDGEAYVGIKRSTWGMRNRTDILSPTYSERVQIRMACRPILEFIKSAFGGSLGTEPKIYQSHNGFRGKKIMHCYRASDKVAASLIKATYPYLLEKRIQANCILALRRNKESKPGKNYGNKQKGRPRLTKNTLAYRQQLWQQCKDCHK